MLAFIYLAYSMMALLYLLHETVPTFEDTWIECLGHLGRYRMAKEDDERNNHIGRPSRPLGELYVGPGALQQSVGAAPLLQAHGAGIGQALEPWLVRGGRRKGP